MKARKYIQYGSTIVSGEYTFLKRTLMMMMMKKTAGTILVMALILLCIGGCASKIKMKYLDEPYTEEKIIVPVVIREIEINDERENIASADIEIPRRSKNGDQKDVQPPLSAEHRKILEDEIGKYVTSSGTEVKAVVEIFGGEKKFEAARFSEVERVKVKLGITLYDSSDAVYFAKSNGEAMYELKSLDASEEYIEKLYCKALKASVYKCFEGIRNYLKEKNSQ